MHDVANIHNDGPVVTRTAPRGSWPLLFVCSGGQDGVDITALRVAKASGYRTDGMMPRGCRTDIGPRPEWAKEFGLRQSTCATYGPRTWWNVRSSQGTLWLGDSQSPGGQLTLDYCRQLRRPHYVLDRLALQADDAAIRLHAAFVRSWIIAETIVTLNVAGNRERTQPGISREATRLLKLVFSRTSVT